MEKTKRDPKINPLPGDVLHDMLLDILITVKDIDDRGTVLYEASDPKGRVVPVITLSASLGHWRKINSLHVVCVKVFGEEEDSGAYTLTLSEKELAAALVVIDIAGSFLVPGSNIEELVVLDACEVMRKMIEIAPEKLGWGGSVPRLKRLAHQIRKRREGQNA